jgi:hypothetical protein
MSPEALAILEELLAGYARIAQRMASGHMNESDWRESWERALALQARAKQLRELKA